MSSPACSACLLWQQANTRGMLIMPGAWHFQNISSNILSSCPFSAHVTHCALALSGERYAIFNLVEQKVVDSSPSTFFFFFYHFLRGDVISAPMQDKTDSRGAVLQFVCSWCQEEELYFPGSSKGTEKPACVDSAEVNMLFRFRVGYVNHELKQVLSSLGVG